MASQEQMEAIASRAAVKERHPIDVARELGIELTPEQVEHILTSDVERLIDLKNKFPHIDRDARSW